MFSQEMSDAIQEKRNNSTQHVHERHPYYEEAIRAGYQIPLIVTLDSQKRNHTSEHDKIERRVNEFVMSLQQRSFQT